MPRRRPRDLVPSGRLGTPQLTPRPELPRPGRALAEALARTDHCIERYRARAAGGSRATAAELRDELAGIIASEGIAVKRPPSWFFGGRGANAFYVTVDGQWVLPVQPARLVDGSLPSRPYVANTFITRDISEADLAEFTGEELATLINLPQRVVSAWNLAAEDGEQPAEQRLRDLIAATGRPHRNPPAWLRSRRPASDRFFIALDDGALLVVSRARRDEGHPPPSAPPTCSTTTPSAGSPAMNCSPRSGSKRARFWNTPARCPASQTTRAGTWSNASSRRDEWSTSCRRGWPGRVTWHGAALLLGDDAVLLLRPQPPLTESDPPRWRATRTFVR